MLDRRRISVDAPAVDAPADDTSAAVQQPAKRKFRFEINIEFDGNRVGKKLDAR
ncbi:MAG TPA: hypothetical protein VHZ24_05300 [Pirellulales bacterium]|jgi:hypothetical protein|nr:hypothetical protein [Pirellulales bacterium]